MESRADPRSCGANFTHLLPYDYPDFALSGGEGVAVVGFVALAGVRQEELRSRAEHSRQPYSEAGPSTE
jgi:hypothetical protein